jgi:hypothetical protein
MNRAALVCALMTVSLSAAAAPTCCTLFGIDATPILGDDVATCGALRHANNFDEAETLNRDERIRGAECARVALASGRSVVYTYRQLIWPDVDLIIQAVWGSRGERLLLKLGNYRNESIRVIEVCAMLEVQPGGRIDSAGCTDRHPLLDRLHAGQGAR